MRMMCHRQFCTLDFGGIFVGADSGGFPQKVDMKMFTFWILDRFWGLEN